MDRFAHPPDILGILDSGILIFFVRLYELRDDELFSVDFSIPRAYPKTDL